MCHHRVILLWYDAIRSLLGHLVEALGFVSGSIQSDAFLLSCLLDQVGLDDHSTAGYLVVDVLWVAIVIGDAHALTIYLRLVYLECLLAVYFN